MAPGDFSADVLTSAPFVVVPGVINIRAIGGYPTSQPGLSVKPVILFRSGEPTRITAQGKEALRALGVRRVFDLRSDKEIRSYDAPAPTIDGVEFVRAPVSEKEAYDPVSLTLRLKAFEADELEAFLALYAEILESGGPAFEAILRHLKDHPDEPCLVHCTAGKDRTGLAAALILMLLGVSDDDIVHDYALTTAGLVPFLPTLIERFQKKAVFRDYFQGTMNMGSSRPETMAATLRMIRDRYGSAEGYLKSHTSLSDEDFKGIRGNFLVRS